MNWFWGDARCLNRKGEGVREAVTRRDPYTLNFLSLHT